MRILVSALSSVTFSVGVPIGLILGGLVCGARVGMKLSIRALGLADMFDFSKEPR